MSDLPEFVEGKHYTVDSSGCWLWLYCKVRDGYGTFNHHGKSKGAHRWSYEKINGTVDSSLYILHKCDTPACINPAHLFAGTQLDNMRDMRTKKPHYKAILTEQKILYIRQLRSIGCTHQVIADIVKISRHHVTNILNRKRWVNV